MIPLAAWAGLPSTACVCSDGRLKLFCGHPLKADSVDHHTGCAANCCGDNEVVKGSSESDCCGGGFCDHGGKSGVGSKSCCNPILTAPSVAPQTASVPCDQAPAIVAAVEEVGALVHPSFSPDVAEFNTGPPLDRVIVFRSLLI
jgi:hypothetical protein